MSSLPPSQAHLRVLKSYFGFTTFRPAQWKIIRSIIEDRRDTCAALAPGYGKLLCYKYPSVYLNKITIILIPRYRYKEVIPCMKFKGNIPYCFINSSEDVNLMNDITNKKYLLVYSTIDFVIDNEGKQFLDKIRGDIVMIGVDEDETRRSNEKSKQSKLKEVAGSIPVLVITRSSKESDRNLIVSNFGLNNPQTILGFTRENLEFLVKLKRKYKDSLIWKDIKDEVLKVKEGSIVIYCTNGTLYCQLMRSLEMEGIKFVDDGDDENFIKNNIRILIYSKPWGVGVYKRDVQLLIYYGAGSDLFQFYEQAFCIGQDGARAKVIMYYDRDDIRLKERGEHCTISPNRDDLSEESKYLYEYCATTECRGRFLTKHFEGSDEEFVEKEICCDNCERKKNNGRQDFEGLDENGCYDFGKDAKLLLGTLIYCFDDQLTYLKVPILLLLGRNSSTIKPFHKANRNYGAGKGKSEQYWRALAALLHWDGYCENRRVENQYHVKENEYVASDKGKEWYKGRGKTTLKIRPGLAMIEHLKLQKTAPKYPKKVKSEMCQNLLKLLYKKRDDIAQNNEIAPYHVISSLALEQMATKQPVSFQEMIDLNLNGFSDSILNTLGIQFLNVIQESRNIPLTTRIPTEIERDVQSGPPISTQNSDVIILPQEENVPIELTDSDSSPEIVESACKSTHNKRLVYLPSSSGDDSDENGIPYKKRIKLKATY